MAKTQEETLNYIEELSLSLQQLALNVEQIEHDLIKVKKTIQTLSTLKDNIWSLDEIIQDQKKQRPQKSLSQSNSIEWEFDGYFMVGEDMKKYPVPVNYSSKSKLIPGDRLKVTIKDNGELIYKLILPAERQHIRAVLSKDTKEQNKFLAITNDKQVYNLNTAAVSYFKWLSGDEIYITINKEGKWNYAALDAIIKDNIA